MFVVYLLTTGALIKFATFYELISHNFYIFFSVVTVELNSSEERSHGESSCSRTAAPDDLNQMAPIKSFTVKELIERFNEVIEL